MSLDHLQNKLAVLLDSFTDIQLIPKSCSRLLLPFYQSIAESEKLKDFALERCLQTFNQWENRDPNMDDAEVVQRCLDMWFIIKRSDYELKRRLPGNSNLIIEDIEVTDYVETRELDRLEFHPETYETLATPLDNLIIEEVEVTHFVDTKDFSNK